MRLLWLSRGPKENLTHFLIQDSKHATKYLYSVQTF